MLWLLLACSKPAPPIPPGILLVTVDTWRADHFSEHFSPEAWNVAQKGLRFENAYTTIGLTTPAHASLFTGLYPAEHGLRANNHHGYVLNPEYLTLAESLKSKGWSTGAFVSAYPAGPEGGLDQGFEVFDGPDQGERPTQTTLATARKWLSQQEGPWFLWVHAYEPHGPYTPPKAMQSKADGKGEKGAYAGEVRWADHMLGPLYREVLASDGWVVVTSDHGEVLDEEPCNWQHERSSGEGVLRIPLAIAGPGIDVDIRKDPVSIIDLFPSIHTIAKIPDPGGHQAQDLLAPVKREVWYAESGLCEPDCSPGCSPKGILGKDLVALSPDGQLQLRPGRGFEGRSELKPQLESYGKPDAPTESPQIEQGRALGYLD